MMMLGCAPINTSDKVFSFSPSALSVGAISANQFTGFIHPAGSITSITLWGSTNKIFTASSYSTGSSFGKVFETRSRGRDVEVTTWSNDCVVIMRANNGRSLSVSIGNSGAEFYVYYSSGLLSNPTTNNWATVYEELTETNNLAALIGGGYNPASTSGNTFTFGCDGFTLYCKWNGTTFFETNVWYHMEPGSVILCAKNHENGPRDTSVTFSASSPTYSDGDNKIVDLRDFGMREVITTGSMSAASTSLTVASATGFQIGDQIIVATGGEAGAGLKKSNGVGGRYPTDSYANPAAFPAASTYRAANGNVDVFVIDESTGNLWINYLASGVPTWSEWTEFNEGGGSGNPSAYYYGRYWVPRALYATITNIVGNVLTLDTAAFVATTNADVYLDCAQALQPIKTPMPFVDVDSYSLVSDDFTVLFPAGEFALSEYQALPKAQRWLYKGAGIDETTFTTPSGCPQVSFRPNGNYVVMSDFTIVGNDGENYWVPDRTTTNTFAQDYRSAVVNAGTYDTGNRFERIKLVNTYQGINLAASIDGAISDCHGIKDINGASQSYHGWFFTASDSSNVTIENCTFDSYYMHGAFELFKCNFSSKIVDCSSINGIWAANGNNDTGGAISYIRPTLTCNMRFPLSGWMEPTGSMININDNIFTGSAAGGSIIDPTITVTKNGDGNMYFGISIQTSVPNFEVIGTHTAKPGTGVITMSDWESGDDGRGAVGVTADNYAIVRGIRVIGLTEPPSGSYTFSNISLRALGVIEDCVAEDMGINDPGTATWTSQSGINGNITNAAYDAL